MISFSVSQNMSLIEVQQNNIRTMSQTKNSQKGGANNLNQFNKYLDNNVDVLKQKFEEYFGEPFPFAELTNPSEIQYALKFIYDVFNFGKYEANPTLNKTLRSSLTLNLKSFASTHSQQYVTFSSETAIKLLKYCIEHNEMFAVHYDKKKPQKKPQEEVVQKKQEPKQAQEPKHEEKLQKSSPQQPKQQKIQPKQEQKEEPKVPTPVPQTKNSRLSKKSQMTQKNSFEEIGNKNEFLTQHTTKVQNTELIKKQLKGVFEFYCKQQQNLSPTSTFDNIDHKCKTMNMGKFMAFAIASNLVQVKDKSYSQGKLDKRVIVGSYKKVAEGQKEIGFPKFWALMQELKKVDPDIYTRLGVGYQGPKGQNKLLEKLKYLTLPFSTRDPDGRQIMPHNRIFVPKLTTHSGKNQVDLRDELKSRKEKGKIQPSERSRFLSGGSRFVPVEDHTKFTLKLGSSNDHIERQDLSFLSKLIKEQDNDQLFLKEYQLPPKRVNGLQGLDQNNKSVDRGRYRDDHSDISFSSKSGALTSRKTKKQDFVLPSISRKGMQTQLPNQRHSIGLTKRFGDRSILN